MIRVLQNLYDLAIQRPRWTLVLWALLLVPTAYELSRLTIDLDMYGREQKEFGTTREFQEFKNRFQDAYSSVMIFVPPTGRRFSGNELCMVRDWLARDARNAEGVLAVASPFDLRTARREGNRIWYRPIFEPDCNSTATTEELKALQTTPWHATLTDKSARDLAAEILFSADNQSRFGEFDPEKVSALTAQAKTNFSKLIPGSEIHLVGSPAFQAHLKDALFRDLGLQSLVFVILLIAFRYFFGTWMSGTAFLFALVIALVAVYGLMAATGQPLDLLTNNLLLMTTIAGLEDMLFLAMHMKTRRKSFAEATRDLAIPCLFTTLTTVIGFLSLEASGVAMIARFGLWSGVAAFFEWAVLFSLFPACAAYLPALVNWVDDRKAHAPNWPSRLAERHPHKAILLAGFGIFALGLVGFRFININEHPAKNFASEHPLSKAYKYIGESRGWENSISVVFKRPGIEDEQSEIENRLSQIAKNPIVASTETPFGLTDFLARDLASQGDRDVPRIEAKSTFAFRRFFSGLDQARAQIYLKTTDLKALNDVVETIRKVCSDGFCAPVGQSVVYLEFAKKIIPALLSSFIWSSLLVGLVLIAVASALGIKSKWRLIYSALWGPVAMVAVIATLQIPVNLITSVFAAIIVGLTGDNAIQYIFASRDGDLTRGVEERAETSVILAALLAACSLVFLLESVKPMVTLGVLFFIGFAVNLIGDLWMLKGLLENKKAHSIGR